MTAPLHSLRAEQAVIGSLMLDDRTLVAVQDWLAPDDFFGAGNRAIYTAILAAAAKGQPFDSVTLAESLDGTEALADVGGPGYLIDLASTTPSAANVVAYAEILVEHSRMRQAADVGQQLTDMATAGKGRSSADVVAIAQQRLAELAPSKRTGPQPIRQALRVLFDDIAARWEEPAPRGLPMPWADVNDAILGLQDGEVVLIAGRSNMGKSVLGFQLASFSALRGTRTLLFSMEMNDHQVARRNVASVGRIPYRWLQQPTQDADHWAELNQAIRDLRDVPLQVDDSPALASQQIAARAQRMHLQSPLRLVVVDHLHEMRLPGKQGEVIERGQAMRDLKALAKTLRCPVVVLAQLNRAAEGSTGNEGRPGLRHLRGSGGIEEVADVVLLVHRPDYYKPDDRKGLVEVIVGKGRDVETGRVINLRNNFWCMRADDWQGEAPQPARESGRREFGYDGKTKAAGDGRANSAGRDK